jgi:hypothetical protein
MHGIAMLRNRSIVMVHHRAIVTEEPMKKHQVATELAAKLSAAANQPAGKGKPRPSIVGPQLPTSEPTAPVATAAEPASSPSKAPAKESTVIITLRPRITLWRKCVAKAAERMRQQGRAVSPQQIILEALERSFT